MTFPKPYRRALLAAFVAALLAATLINSRRTSSQTLGGDLWRDVAEASILPGGARAIVPEAYRTVRLDRGALRSLLAAAPLEFTAAARETQTVLSLPMPDGSFARFRVEDSPIMEPGLAAYYKDWKTYRGQGLDDPTATARFGVTSAGLHAIILSAGDTVYIDPYAKGDAAHHISYFKRHLAGDKRFECKIEGFDQQAAATNAAGGEFESNVVASAGTLRTYRLALAATGEYTMHFNELTELDEEKKKDNAFAAMVATMNRVNGVYERELSVRMVFIDATRSIIFTNPVVDPYTNNPVYPVDMLVENQLALDALVGEANYDIGHVVSTGFGGVAFLNSVCDKGVVGVPGDGFNAGGFTGLDNPVGDGFDIDFVAHEMGHQFGGNHTFNGSDGSCGGNEGAASAYEPGSGTTIQAYAGICATQDLQPHSDDYFHVKSLEEMVAFLRGSGGGCSVQTPVANAAPTVSAGADYTIPRDTPFKLTASGSDPDGDPLNYTWEEYDLGPSAPAGGSGDNDNDGQARPIFRSYKGTPDPSRTFPSLRYVLDHANNPPATYDCGRGASEPCITGEDLPSMTRTMKCPVTARDYRAVGGGVASDLVEINVRAEAGPFVVREPNTGATWEGASTQTVAWDVAGTNAAPINATDVRISLSTDGGQTFPHVLADSTPNDGSHTVVVPNLPTGAARIKVEAVGNIFFDISGADFTITQASARLADISISSLTNGCVPELQGKVTLEAPAPAGGAVVTITETHPAASFPATVVVPEGQTTRTFAYTVSPVAARVSGIVNASGGGVTLSRTLTLRPIRVTALTLSPSRLRGGGTSTGTVTLECGAAPASINVVLESGAPATAATPPGVVVPAGAKTATFNVTTSPVVTSKSVAIKATAGGVSVSTNLVVDP